MKESDKSRALKTVQKYWELIGKPRGGRAPVVIQRYTEAEGGEDEARNGLARVTPYYERAWVVVVQVVTEREILQ